MQVDCPATHRIGSSLRFQQLLFVYCIVMESWSNCFTWHDCQEYLSILASDSEQGTNEPTEIYSFGICHSTHALCQNVAGKLSQLEHSSVWVDPHPPVVWTSQIGFVGKQDTPESNIAGEILHFDKTQIHLNIILLVMQPTANHKNPVYPYSREVS